MLAVEEIDFSSLWVITGLTISLIRNDEPAVLFFPRPHLSTTVLREPLYVSLTAKLQTGSSCKLLKKTNLVHIADGILIKHVMRWLMDANVG